MCARRECVCVCVHVGVRVRDCTEETAHPSSHKASHLCDPPQNCPVFDARH